MTHTPEVTHETINAVYNELYLMAKRYGETRKTYEDAKAELEVHFAYCLANELISGSNDSKRKADHMEKYPEFYNAMAKALDEMDEDRNSLELARIEVERVRALLRVDEMLAGISRLVEH